MLAFVLHPSRCIREHRCGHLLLLRLSTSPLFSTLTQPVCRERYLVDEVTRPSLCIPEPYDDQLLLFRSQTSQTPQCGKGFVDRTVKLLGTQWPLGLPAYETALCELRLRVIGSSEVHSLEHLRSVLCGRELTVSESGHRTAGNRTVVLSTLDSRQLEHLRAVLDDRHSLPGGYFRPARMMHEHEEACVRRVVRDGEDLRVLRDVATEARDRDRLPLSPLRGGQGS